MSIPLTRHETVIDGDKQVFWAYWPTVDLKGSLVACHGAGRTGRTFAENNNHNFVQQAKKGYACVFPDGLRNEEGRRAWALEGPIYEKNRLFLHWLCAKLLERGAPGAGLLGNSSGGYMTWRMRLDDFLRRQGRFCWYAPGAANLPKTWATHMGPRPTFIIHGTKDPKVPFDGTETQFGWQAALRAIATINNNGKVPDDFLEHSERSCAGRTTEFYAPKGVVTTIGAKIVNGRHAWHACDRWQMQQMILDWADRFDLWTPNPIHSTDRSVGDEA